MMERDTAADNPQLEHRYCPLFTVRADDGMSIHHRHDTRKGMYWGDDDDEDKDEDEDEDRAAPLTLRGYAATFNDEYEVMGVTESVQRGAFARSLREHPDVFALLGHDMNRVVARTKNNSLRLREDKHGLQVEIMMIDTPDSRAAFDLVRTGTLDAMSFGFTIREQKLKLNNGQVQRVLTDVELYEVSLVAMPANPNAAISPSAQALKRSAYIRLRPLVAVPPIVRR